MFARTLSKQTVLNSLYVSGLLLTGVLLLYRPQAVTTGISRGLSVCTGVIIPTLYPFMLLSGLLADSPLCRRPTRWLSTATWRLFGLPGCCGTAILLSLVGGYPAGALTIGHLQRQGQIDDDQTRKMLTYCVCGGPGFIISTVGAGLLNSGRAGMLLFIAQGIASLVIGFWQGRRLSAKSIQTPPSYSRPRPLATIISDTCSALLTMCGFVVLAAVVLSLFEACGVPTILGKFTGLPARYWSTVLAVITEVSSGCIALAGGFAHPFLLSLALSWAGLSVQGQIAASIPKGTVWCPHFWGWRLFHGITSGILATLLFTLIPTDVATMENGVTAVPHGVSFSASVMLLLLSFLAMLCFSPKKTGKMN